MKLPPNIHLFQVTADLSSVRGRRKTYHTILKLADHALFKMACPPATSEAGANLLKVSCHFK
jgi:hypothetical protein